MGSTNYQPSVKEVDGAFRQGNVDESLRLLYASNVHPESVDFWFRRALIALAQKELDYAEQCVSRVQLPPEQRARYLRHRFRAYMRAGSTGQACLVLDELKACDATNPGWLLDMRGYAIYVKALHGMTRSTRINLLKEATRYFKKADKYWQEHASPMPSWINNHRWLWFVAEWHLSRRLHMPSKAQIDQLDRLRWDVIDNDPSCRRRLAARMPQVFLPFAGKLR